MRVIFLFILFLGVISCSNDTSPAPVISIDLSNIDPVATTIIQKKTTLATSAEDWQELGKIYHAHDLTDAAITAYTYALSLKREPQTQYLLGVIFAKKGNYQEGIDMLSGISSYAPAQWRQGFWNLDLARPDLALQHFNAAKKLDQTAVAPIIGLARTHLLLNQPEQSIALLQGLLDQNVKHSYITFLLGTAHQRAGNTTVAEQLLLGTKSGQPKWKDPWLDEMRYHKFGFAADLNRAIAKIDANKLQEALSLLIAIDSKYPYNDVVQNNLATVYLQLGKQDEAIKLLGKAIRKSPEYAPLHLTMAFSLASVGEVQRATNYAKDALKIQPSMFAAATLIGKLSVQQKDYQQAIRYFAQAIGLGDTNPSTREMLADMLLRFRQWDTAISEYNIVLATSPNRTASIGGLAFALASKGEFEEANRVLNIAIRKFPNDPNLARALTAVQKVQQNP